MTPISGTLPLLSCPAFGGSRKNEVTFELYTVIKLFNTAFSRWVISGPQGSFDITRDILVCHDFKEVSLALIA